MNDIDPIQFGELRADMANMKANMALMVKKIDELTELANKSKGGLWAGMAIVSFVSGFFTWTISHISLAVK